MAGSVAIGVAASVVGAGSKMVTPAECAYFKGLFKVIDPASSNLRVVAVVSRSVVAFPVAFTAIATLVLGAAVVLAATVALAATVVLAATGELAATVVLAAGVAFARAVALVAAVALAAATTAAGDANAFVVAGGDTLTDTTSLISCNSPFALPLSPI